MFREIYAKYKRGEATEEEIRIIEEELEKYEIINELIADALDEDSLFEEENPIETVGDTIVEDKKIIKKVNRNITYKLLTYLSYISIACFIISILARVVYDPFIKFQHYNPILSKDNYSNIYPDFDTFTELSCPGYKTTLYLSGDKYADYTLSGTQEKPFSREEENVEIELSNGVIEETKNVELNVAWHKDFKISNSKKGDDEILSHIKELPGNAVANVYMRFDEDLTMENTEKMISRNKGLEFNWLWVRSQNKYSSEDSVFGFNPNNIEGDKEMHYRGLLNYLKDRDRFLTLLDSSNDYVEMPYNYNPGKALKYVKKNGVKISGLMVTGRLDDLVKLRESEKIKFTKINDIKISPYSK